MTLEELQKQLTFSHIDHILSFLDWLIFFFDINYCLSFRIMFEKIVILFLYICLDDQQ